MIKNKNRARQFVDNSHQVIIKPYENFHFTIMVKQGRFL